MGDDKTPDQTLSLADAARTGDRRALTQIVTAPLRPANNNLVSRPWAGRRLCGYKQVDASSARTWGEAFEICAHDSDEEANAHPSDIVLPDGSTASLPELLALAGSSILGESFVKTRGYNMPLLPKTLDVGELLSIQAHPEGSTEAYIIIEADEGATLRLGFKSSVNPEHLGKRLDDGLHLQRTLLEQLHQDVNQNMLQSALKGYFAQRELPVEATLPALEPMLPGPADQALLTALRSLKDLYWDVLDLMNEITVSPGMVIHNANPPAVSAASGRKRSAEIHALGNPQGREILALEIRSPAPTFRAWDNVRFPMRPVDVGTTLRAVNLEATRPEDFIVTPEQLEGHPGVFRSVEDEAFTVHHLRPRLGINIRPPADGQWHMLHCIHGSVRIGMAEEATSASLRQGQSALIPVAMDSYRLTADGDNAEVIMVTVA